MAFRMPLDISKLQLSCQQLVIFLLFRGCIWETLGRFGRYRCEMFWHAVGACLGVVCFFAKVERFLKVVGQAVRGNQSCNVRNTQTRT